MRRLLLLLAATALIAPAALADDLADPPWERYTEGTTYQHWTFDSYDPDTDDPRAIPPDECYNPYAPPDPIIDVPYGGQYDFWQESYEGHTGVWAFADYGWFEIGLPNSGDDSPGTWKDVYLQITWHPSGDKPAPEMWVPDGEVTEDSQIVGEDGWIWTRWYVHLEPNPDFERIDVWSEYLEAFYVDQVVVDTICIPEPGPLGLLALGALALLRRR